ncbi:hypothetical protein [Streptococcus sanguinis]|jgi:hypothetical protein|uniref:Uncharacterized protein n=2 Tax=Streptococcus TaxID=1301 RepID=A0A2X3VG93_STRSA|nr:hypothetical protein HMPREF9396_0703 [Streptococcus sanguinis SK1059]EGQ20992.1 hypothetical protein HMPREF8573_0695 [Streptococcus sanguinis ATCC 29667]EGQ24548.1 hypothetical protein HMPREF9387_1252 [Streptococcus sanguinis SK340]SQF34779.1 Uncharacterised protein [Streptococcus sanguinis]
MKINKIKMERWILYLSKKIRHIRTVEHTDYGLTTPCEHSAITLAQLTSLLLTVYSSGDALVATNMINKWVDVVREEYFKTHDFIFPDDAKLWDEDSNLS